MSSQPILPYVQVRTHVAYAALRGDPAAWEEIEQKQRAWDATLDDGPNKLIDTHICWWYVVVPVWNHFGIFRSSILVQSFGGEHGDYHCERHS